MMVLPSIDGIDRNMITSPPKPNTGYSIFIESFDFIYLFSY